MSCHHAATFIQISYVTCEISYVTIRNILFLHSHARASEAGMGSRVPAVNEKWEGRPTDSICPQIRFVNLYRRPRIQSNDDRLVARSDVGIRECCTQRDEFSIGRYFVLEHRAPACARTVSTLSPTGMRLHWLGGGGAWGRCEQTSTCHRNIVTVTLSEWYERHNSERIERPPKQNVQRRQHRKTAGAGPAAGVFFFYKL